jgi:hypothetical protein
LGFVIGALDRLISIVFKIVCMMFHSCILIS